MAETFKIDSLDKAAWAMRKIAEARKERTKLEEYAKREHQRVDDWLKKEIESLDDSTAPLEAMLVEYYKDLRKRNPRAKLTTPYGKVTSRSTQKVAWGDSDRLVEWLEANGEGDYIRKK